VDYLKTSAVLAAYVDQSISTNTFYNPAHYPQRKIPATLVARNLMLAHKWGLKSLYYSLVNKQGSKTAQEPEQQPLATDIEDIDDSDCDACKL
jgi:ribonucleoside-diphosphate reductase alpha chain